MQPILLVLFLALALAAVIWALYRYPEHRMHWRMHQQKTHRASMRRNAHHRRH